MELPIKLSAVNKNYRYKVVRNTSNEEIYLLDTEYRVRGCLLYALNWRTSQKLYKITAEQLGYIKTNRKRGATENNSAGLYTRVGAVVGVVFVAPMLRAWSEANSIPLSENWRYVALAIVMLGALGARILFSCNRRKKIEQSIKLSELETVEAMVTPIIITKQHRNIFLAQLFAPVIYMLMAPMLYIQTNNLLMLLLTLLIVPFTYGNKLAFEDGDYSMEFV